MFIDSVKVATFLGTINSVVFTDIGFFRVGVRMISVSLRGICSCSIFLGNVDAEADFRVILGVLVLPSSSSLNIEKGLVASLILGGATPLGSCCWTPALVLGSVPTHSLL